VEGLQIHLVHGSPRRINEYLLPGREPRTFRRIAAQETADILVFGHTHKAWHRTYDHVLFINVGSVGRPTDGDPRAGYTLLQIGPGSEREVREVRVAYDPEKTASEIHAVGLPAELAEEIRFGRRA
jgi:predicted phosphodiesterase